METIRDRQQDRKQEKENLCTLVVTSAELITTGEATAKT